MGGGTLVEGDGRAGGFVESVAGELAEALGFRPYPGTLNLTGVEVTGEPAVTLPVADDDHCDGVDCHPRRVAGVRAAVIRPLVPDYPDGKTELVAPVGLRRLFGLSTDDAVPLDDPDDVPREGAAGLRAHAAELDAFDAVIFDLDGTLVDLDVDWDAVFGELDALLDGVIDAPIGDHSRGELYRLAREAGRYDALDEVLTRREREGVETTTARPLLDVLPELDCPVGVCTANAASVAEAALDRFGVDVDVVVGRATVPEQKPDPRPLWVCLGDLGVAPGDAAFVGDGSTDAGTALAAGTSYHHPARLRTDVGR